MKQDINQFIRVSQSKTKRGNRFLTALALFIGVIALAGVRDAYSSGQVVSGNESVNLSPLLDGQITGVGPTSLEVEGKLYFLHPKVSVTDEGGHPLDVKQLQIGGGVQFRLKDGAMYQIIALRPR